MHPRLFNLPRTSGTEVLPAPPTPAHAAVAAKLPDAVRLGTSSWSFPGWAGLVYAEQATPQQLAKAGLGAYANHPLLRAVGVDRTFYSPISVQAYANYANQVPESFRFLVKAHEWLTLSRFPNRARYGPRAGQVNPHFLDPTYAAEQVIGPAVQGLGAKLGTVLFQFPPHNTNTFDHPQAAADALHRFLDALPRGPLYSTELRNPAWFTTSYASALTDVGAAHCYNALPKLPTIAEQMRLVPGGARAGLVVRWMIHPQFTYQTARDQFAPFDRLAAPDPTTRTAIARLVALAVSHDKPTLVIANNKAEGSSPLTIWALAECIAQQLNLT